MKIPFRTDKEWLHIYHNRTTRLCKLLGLNAPRIVVVHEIWLVLHAMYHGYFAAMEAWKRKPPLPMHQRSDTLLINLIQQGAPFEAVGEQLMMLVEAHFGNRSQALIEWQFYRVEDPDEDADENPVIH
jgi:hypothetical protein